MNKFLHIIILTLLIVGKSAAQEPEHLRPVPVTGISLVVHDTSHIKNPIVKLHCSYVDTSITFYECRNDTGVVGYLLEYSDNRPIQGYKAVWDHTSNSSEGVAIHVGLKEVQRAEQLLAKTLDLKADSSQWIRRAFTAPRFYQYARQYIFYAEPNGDTCVLINFAIPDEWCCLSSRWLEVCDGGDYYWKAILNLSKEQILHYYVNGPEIKVVEGRNKEPKGLIRDCIFRNGTLYREEAITYNQLPKKVQTKVENPHDTTNTYIEVHHKGRLYYLIFSDSIQKGYQENGSWVFTGAENLFSGNLPAEKIQKVPHIHKMLSYIHGDMSRRGRDFGKFGKLLSIEAVENHYVIHVWYYPDIDHYKMWVAYTFDRNGNFTGIDIDDLH